MANLNVSYQEMRGQAQALRRGESEITSQLNGLRSQIQNLVTSGFVTDAASGAFQNSYEQFNHGAQQTISALNDLAANLENIASTLEQTDEELARRMSG